MKLRKYCFLLMFFSVFLFVISLMTCFFYFKLEPLSKNSEMNISKIKLKIDKFNHYEMNYEDSEFLKNLINTIETGNERFAAQVSMLKSLMYLLVIISLSQGVTTILLFTKNRKQTAKVRSA